MARIGSFDTTLRSLTWFDDAAVSEGWFDADLVDTGVSGGNSQAVALTLDDVTSSFSQTLQHNQSSALTLGDVTFAAVQTTTHTQAVALTLDGVAVAASQTNTGHDASSIQTIAFTLDDVAVTIQQRPPEASATIGSAGGGLTRLRKRQDEELIEIVMTLIAEEVI